ncbi:MAG: ribose-phosphate pyrophosphokinase [Maricaulis maris]
MLFDDMCDSGGTLVNAADALLEKGAIEVSAYVTHGVLSKDAQGRVDKSRLRELVVTDSVTEPPNSTATPKVRRLSVAPLLGEAIRRIANDESVSKLFD